MAGRPCFCLCLWALVCAACTMKRDGALPGVSTGVVVGHRAVPCWPFPNQRRGKHASLARPVTKHAITKDGQIGQNGAWEYGGGLPAELAAPAACPSFKPKRISSLFCRSRAHVWSPTIWTTALESMLELTVSHFPKGSRFSGFHSSHCMSTRYLAPKQLH